jgi:hypothetical protein
MKEMKKEQGECMFTLFLKKGNKNSSKWDIIFDKHLI